MLEVVQHEQQRFLAQIVAQRLLRIGHAQPAQLEGVGDGGDHAVSGIQRREVHEPNSVRMAIGALGGGGKRQAGLADAARAGQCQQPAGRVVEQCC